MIDVKEAAAKISRNGPGALIVNADDWGCDRETTDKTADCVSRGSVSAVSAMVLMQDSERAAAIARERGIDCGLHLNFTTGYSAASVSSRLVKHQNRTSTYLRRNPFARVFYHPRLAHDFEYVVAAQIDEYRRLYGADPQRLDGHHHMHLCANVVFGKLLPAGSLVRRNFSLSQDARQAPESQAQAGGLLISAGACGRNRTAGANRHISPGICCRVGNTSH
jgi:chitin disaccharide deacetylase